MFRKVAIVLIAALLLTNFQFLRSEATPQKWVLVVGGAGFIGSHVNELLYRHGYQTVVLDNLSKGNREAIHHGIFIEGDIADADLLSKIFETYPIDAVMHFAAFLEVGESVVEPLKYYINNVANTLNLLETMRRHEVNIFIFSSSAAIFGNPQERYVTESHPCHPINPYGQTKLMMETILHDLGRASNLRYCCLRYFNVAGGDPAGLIKNYKTKDANLIPIVLRNIKQEALVNIFGTDYPTPDGTCIRDYIHVQDLGAAHIAAMERLLSGAPSTSYNLGNGQGFSVREVIAAAEAVTGKTVRVVEGARRPGDPAVLVASSKKAKEELGWEPRYTSLEEIIEHAWNAMRK